MKKKQLKTREQFYETFTSLCQKFIWPSKILNVLHHCCRRYCFFYSTGFILRVTSTTLLFPPTFSFVHLVATACSVSTVRLMMKKILCIMCHIQKFTKFLFRYREGHWMHLSTPILLNIAWNTEIKCGEFKHTCWLLSEVFVELSYTVCPPNWAC